jgi:hypothetical protein
MATKISDHVLGISSDDLDRYIYRIFRPQHLLSMFGNGENVLVSPAKWDDPYENLLLRAKYRLPDGTIVTWGSFDVYAQCWMKTVESDAMWRVYSPDTYAIRARTTIRKLVESLVASRDPAWVHLEVFLGAVTYKNNKNFKNWVSSYFATSAPPQSRDLAATLLVKRYPFNHEKEVRLLLLPAQNKNTGAEFHKYKIDPHHLFDRLMVDSRAPKPMFEMYEHYFLKELKFKGDFRQSKLYATPVLPPLTFGSPPTTHPTRAKKKKKTG